jgi:Zn-dependent protease with chaperone function
MKTIALLFSMLLIVLFGLFMLVDFVSLYFGIADILIFAAVALIVYFILRLVGSSLDRSFNNSVQSFLEKKSSEPFADKGLLRTFGFLLITLLPFLFYLFALALLIAASISFYGLILVSSISRVPLALVLGIAVVAIGTAVAVLLGIFRLFWPSKQQTNGLVLSSREHGKLWALTRKVASEIGSKPIDKIQITPYPGIGVYLEGSVVTSIIGRGTRVLEIGLPSVHDLSVDEFQAILAHEYGHFGNRDTSWSSYTSSMGNSLVTTLRSMPGPSSERQAGGLIGLMMSLNPSYWIFRWYVSLYFRITSGFSRVGEVMSDMVAMRMYGGSAFRNGLLKVATNDVIFQQVIQSQWVPEMLQEGKTISSLSSAMEYAFSQFELDELEDLQDRLLLQHEAHSSYDSHPALKIRIDYAKGFADIQGEDSSPMTRLFDDWDQMNLDLTEIYNRRLFAAIGPA